MDIKTKLRETIEVLKETPDTKASIKTKRTIEYQLWELKANISFFSTAIYAMGVFGLLGTLNGLLNHAIAGKPIIGIFISAVAYALLGLWFAPIWYYLYKKEQKLLWGF